MNGNTVSVPQNRIVFLGINSKQPQLSNSLFRQAISSAISRNEICSSAYYNNATPALGPFPSLWKPTAGLLTIQSDFNTEIAKNNIELAGFTKKNKDEFYLLKNNKPITFSLLVNSSNNSRVLAANIIAKRLANVGIKINVNSVSNNKYYSLLRANQFDLYLGEIRYEDNMDIQGLISLNSASALLPNANQSNIVSTSSNKKNEASTSSSFTNSSNQASVEEILNPGEITLTSLEAYKGFYNGDYNLKDLITVFNAELPIIPICFKNGMVIYSDRFGNGISPSTTELFHGIQYLK
jgi:ABC-type transport system substrate-binding protein